MNPLLAQLNTQQVLANGVIGGGASLLIAVVVSLLKKPTGSAQDAAGKPPRPLSPLLVLILVPVSITLIVLGIMWRVTAQNP